MFVYYFSGYSIFDFMGGDKTFNGTLGNITSAPLNTIAHGYNAVKNRSGLTGWNTFEKPIQDHESGYGSDKTFFSRYGGKSKKLRKSLKPRRKSRKTRRKSNNKRSTKRSRK